MGGAAAGEVAGGRGGGGRGRTFRVSGCRGFQWPAAVEEGAGGGGGPAAAMVRPAEGEAARERRRPGRAGAPVGGCGGGGEKKAAARWRAWLGLAAAEGGGAEAAPEPREVGVGEGVTSEKLLRRNRRESQLATNRRPEEGGIYSSRARVRAMPSQKEDEGEEALPLFIFLAETSTPVRGGRWGRSAGVGRWGEWPPARLPTPGVVEGGGEPLGFRVAGASNGRRP